MDYFVYDGALGNNAGLQMVKQLGLHLVSKLRHDSTLYFPFAGEYAGKGKPRKYGEQLTIDTLTEDSLRGRTVKKDVETSLHQVLHKNFAGLANINLLLILAGVTTMIDILQVKYLNNIIEQDHRFIKRITKPMMGFKAVHSAQATINGIETAHMIRKGQLSEENIPAYKQFMALAG